MIEIVLMNRFLRPCERMGESMHPSYTAITTRRTTIGTTP